MKAGRQGKRFLWIVLRVCRPTRRQVTESRRQWPQELRKWRSFSCFWNFRIVSGCRLLGSNRDRCHFRPNPLARSSTSTSMLCSLISWCKAIGYYSNRQWNALSKEGIEGPYWDKKIGRCHQLSRSKCGIPRFRIGKCDSRMHEKPF
jgi:hypothetical protein